MSSSETDPGTEIDVTADDVEDEAPASSIDKLLALTNDRWDIDQQVKTLQTAAGTQPAFKPEIPRAPRIPNVAVPTPYELGLRSAAPPLPTTAATVISDSPPASLPAAPPPLPSRPPPLPASRGRIVAPPPASPSGPPSMRRAPPPLPRVTPEPPSVRPRSSGADRPSLDPLAPGTLVDLLHARVATLEGSDDKISLARAHLELAVTHEMGGDDARASQHAEAALGVDRAFAAAHGLLRRKKHGRGAIAQMLAHIEYELESATSEAATVELLAEKARLVDALGDRADTARAAWEAALTRAPNHAAALKGLEAQITSRALGDGAGGAPRGSQHPNDAAFAPARRAEAYDALAVHLGRMAEAYASAPRLAAWLHIEKAHILERRLGRVDAARGAFERAIALDGSVGPVRAAYVRHLAANGDAAALCSALSDEAQIETDPARSARLELDAAILAHLQLRDDARAILLLERAAARAPTVPIIDRRVLDELVTLHESAGEWLEAGRARRARLQFVNEPAALAFELRALAMVGERIAELEQAIGDVQRALAVDATDPTLVELLDRLLDEANKPEQRVALWLTEAARTEEGPRRAKALAKAAHITELVLSKPDDAVKHLRAAWVASPGDSEVLDHLARLLAPSPSESLDSEVRGLAELYAQAAVKTNDAVRRVAYLEKVALLWEDLLGDTRRAARAYEDILVAAPEHRGALLGLARTAARIGDDRALARALLDEAKQAHDGVDVLSLKTRAATALARIDPARALKLVAEVIDAEPAHASARALETRLHEDAGRWEAAAKSYRERTSHVTKTSDKVSLWLALAQLQETRLRTPYDAIESLKAARAADPAHPVPDVEIARVLSATGNDRALKAAYGDLAATARSPEERARFLLRAAEIDEMRLADDVSAAELYARALAATPDDELVSERLARVLARRAATGPVKIDDGPRGPQQGLTQLAAHVAARLERATSPQAERALSFDLAWLLAEAGDAGPDLARATSMLETIVEAQPDHAPALRVLEGIARRSQAWSALSRVLTREGESLVDVRARLGSLWELASLEEWKLPVSDAQSTYARILELDPTDPGALESLVRREMPTARRGEPRARRAVVSALKSLCAIAPDDGTRLALELKLAMLLEGIAAESSDGSGPQVAREALTRYGEALGVDPLSVTAATGLARLSTRLGDAYGAVAASTSLADLATQPKSRARYLFDAAELLLGQDDDERLGPRAERRARALTLLEKALDADADSTAAAGRLASLRMEDGEGERLVATFQISLVRAQSAEAVIMLGSEIARVARDELGDLIVAIDAMRRVREVAPSHVPSLLTLAELCIAQRSWPEAVEALEAVVARTHEVGPRLTALFALASVYEKVLGKPAEAERALRLALTIEPSNPRALRALLHKLASSRQPGVAPTAAEREEIADLLERLSQAERDPASKCEILLELADMRMTLGDPHGAERALVEAVATAPQNARAFARLGALFRTPGVRDAVSYARALSTVIARGTHLGHVDPRWLATVGQLEVENLGKTRDGIAHLQRATQMDPTLYETRFELASAYAKVGAHEETARTLLAMISPSSRPLAGLTDPGSGLELLERALGAERRNEEALVVSELRAVAGDLDDGRHAWLRARRLPAYESHHGQLDRPTLVTHVLPPEGRHVLLEVAAAIAGIESKMLRADVSELGLTSKDRVSSRSGHPTRHALDRLCKTLGLSDVELVIASSVTRTRVLAQDALWVVVPKSISELAEPTQLASIGRALSRIALGVPWLEELPPPHIEALLVAAARQVVPTFGDDFIDVLSRKLVATYEPSVARALSRRQKKMLEELAPHIAAPQGRPLPIDGFISALARAELRAAYLLCGDLLATIDELRALDPMFLRATERAGPASVSAVLDHPFAGDVARYGLTPEATALRRRIGTNWTG